MPSVLTKEQLAQLAELLRAHNPEAAPTAMPTGDVGGMEDYAAGQQKIGMGLPGMSQAGSRNDWGSNLGRAGAGMASALRLYQGDKATKEASELRKQMLLSKMGGGLKDSMQASGDYYDEP